VSPVELGGVRTPIARQVPRTPISGSTHADLRCQREHSKAIAEPDVIISALASLPLDLAALKEPEERTLRSLKPEEPEASLKKPRRESPARGRPGSPTPRRF
jgi:hypothetical protein